MTFSNPETKGLGQKAPGQMVQLFCPRPSALTWMTGVRSLIPPLPFTYGTISTITRRFLARPWGVALEAAGLFGAVGENPKSFLVEFPLAYEKVTHRVCPFAGEGHVVAQGAVCRRGRGFPLVRRGRSTAPLLLLPDLLTLSPGRFPPRRTDRTGIEWRSCEKSPSRMAPLSSQAQRSLEADFRRNSPRGNCRDRGTFSATGSAFFSSD
jgi:hypothetical protein